MSEEKLQRLLVSASGELERWNEAVSRALTLVSSLDNLTTQREACERCMRAPGSGLGVLAPGYPLATPLLLTRLSLASERCLATLRRERDLMYEVVQRLKRFAREAQNALKAAVAEGLDGASLAMRTADGFSLQDHAHWLHELHCGLRSVLEGVTVAMEALEYTTEGVSKLKAAWQSEHNGMEDICDGLRYSVARIT